MSKNDHHIYPGDRVHGKYYGVEFTGRVTDLHYGWSNDTIIVKVDGTIMVNGTSRDGVSISYYHPEGFTANGTIDKVYKSFTAGLHHAYRNAN